ncbi:MAG: hypothetical protein COV48_03890 [Elusimicrobia bacterium CG11_big_fil_rev_8_21_14_0_20_64_6]|nr:MAG: hypothetical protein COV48_03890 [Elusimicrobia bacterium CG11_big_fil_rev_8_21_14_0_20_64_6]
MSRLFCVDGTNLVRTAYGYGGPAYAAQEDADTDRITVIFAQVCEEAGGDIEVELFFDGAFRALGGARPDNFRVSFTHELPADDMILDRVRSRKWSGGGSMTVVTADGDLGRMAESEGGKWLRVGHGAEIESVVRRMTRGRP